MQLEFKIKKDKKFIIKNLIDADRFVSAHPLIYRMKKVGENKYKVYEKVTFGVIPYYFTYFATILNRENEVKIDAVVMKLTKISMIILLTEDDTLTTVTETIKIQSPLPIKGFMYALFKKQHKILFQNIENIPQ